MRNGNERRRDKERKHDNTGKMAKRGRGGTKRGSMITQGKWQREEEEGQREGA